MVKRIMGVVIFALALVALMGVISFPFWSCMIANTCAALGR